MTLAATLSAGTPWWRPYLAPALVVLVSVVALSVALTAQYQYGLLPCVLCMWQRWCYVGAIACGVGGLAGARSPRIREGMLFLAGIAFLCGLAVSGFHVGVEQGWWEGSQTCQGADFSALNSRAAIKDAILNAPVVACNDVPWSFHGISIAGFNVIFSAFFAAVTFWLAFRRRQA
jgi:disulfide bond formation protein DsbB